MAEITEKRDAYGRRFLAIMLGGIVVVTILLAIAVAVAGHFFVPDSGAI